MENEEQKDDLFWGFGRLEVVRTCVAMPEQYDVTIDGEPAGYLRLRHGEFRADFPQCGGEMVYHSEDMSGDGLFDANERGRFMAEAISALINAWTREAKKEAD